MKKRQSVYLTLSPKLKARLRAYADSKFLPMTVIIIQSLEAWLPDLEDSEQE